jgi:hypothetical protein
LLASVRNAVTRTRLEREPQMLDEKEAANRRDAFLINHRLIDLCSTSPVASRF